MRYSVTLERGSDGGYIAWIHELPGCFARGASREAVESKIGPSIEEFLSWLRAAGEVVPPSRVDFTIVAEVGSLTEAAAADSEILLDDDRQPLTPEYWKRTEGWLRASRRDLLRFLRSLAAADLEARRPEAPRSLREHLVHVGFVELMYAAWTFDLHSRQGIAEFLGWSRRLALARMRALAKARSRAVTQADWGSAPRPETWTARKAARRFLWHERLHLRAARRIRPTAAADGRAL